MIVNLLHWLGVALMLATLWAAVQFDGIPADHRRLEDGNETPETDQPALHLPRGWPGLPPEPRARIGSRARASCGILPLQSVIKTA
jgi:hypothetical protein